MPSFDKFFMESQGRPILYNGMTLSRADKFPVSNGNKLVICIETTNSEYIQGVSIDITGSCEINGEIWKKGKGIRMLFWEDAQLIDPKNIELTVFTKNDFVWIENVWEKKSVYLLGTPSGETITKESKSVDSGHNGAAMIVEEIENGRRYRCNDGHPDENFDDIVFTVQRIN